MTIAEESTAWPAFRDRLISAVSVSASNGTWAGCTTSSHYMSLDPIFRRFHHNSITFSLMYAFQEHFILVLSHDEVVHGKGSLINKMPGDEWQKFANLRMFLRLDVRAPGQKAGLHGRRVRPVAGVESRHAARLAPPNLPRTTACAASCNISITFTKASLRSGISTTPTTVSSGSISTIRTTASSPSCANRRKATLSFSSSTPRRWCATIIGSVCLHAGFYREIINTDAETYGGSNVGNMGGVQSEAGRGRRATFHSHSTAAARDRGI